MMNDMNKKFIYEEKTSRLYAPDGTYLKTLSCPKAIDWNQLIMDDPLDRSRGCNQCGERVLNLDTMPTEDVLAAFDAVHIFDFKPCVATSRKSDKVIFVIQKFDLSISNYTAQVHCFMAITLIPFPSDDFIDGISNDHLRSIRQILGYQVGRNRCVLIIRIKLLEWADRVIRNATEIA